MSERKRKKREPFFSFGSEIEPTKSEGGSGYSMSVTYDEKGKPVVKVITYGEVNIAQLQQNIQQRYPEAKIEGLEKQPLIRVVGEEKPENLKPEKKEEEKRRKEGRKEKKEPLIRIVE